MLNKKRLISSYPDDIKKSASLIAYNPDKQIYYGSWSKKSMHLSSGDIDLVEPVKLSESNSLSKHIQNIVKNVIKTKDCYLGDFKSGSNPYYKVDIGTIKHGKIVGFNKEIMVEEFIKSKEFDDETEKRRILNLFNNKIGLKEWFEISNFLHDYEVLRWNKKELLRGYKEINNEKIYLQDTIQDKDALTKIDIIQFIPSLNRYTEITNYFDVVNDGKSFQSERYLNDLKLNLLKYYFADNYFKFTKRLLAYSLYKKDESTANKLYSIVDSGLGIMYQQYSELKAIEYIIDHYNVNISKFKDQLQTIKGRLGNVYEFDFDEKHIDDLLDRGDIQEIIKHLYNCFNRYTYKKLKEMNMIPLKKKYYP